MSDLPPPAYPPPPLPPRQPPPPPRPPPPGDSNRPLIVIGLVATLVLAIGVGVVALKALDDEGTDTTVRTVRESTVTTTAPQAPGSNSGVSDSASPPVPEFTTYIPSESGFYYLADLPTGTDWSEPDETHPTSGELLRTTVRGPSETLLLIDRTPNEVPQIGGGYETTRSVTQPEFGVATEYIFRNSETIPECLDAVCVDYLINDGRGGGWGVLAGGPNLGFAQTIAGRVMRSISLTDY